MNSPRGSCSFPRVNYLSLLSLNESAVPVIKPLRSISAPLPSRTPPLFSRPAFSLKLLTTASEYYQLFRRYGGTLVTFLVIPGPLKRGSPCFLITPVIFIKMEGLNSPNASSVHCWRKIIPICQGLILPL